MAKRTRRNRLLIGFCFCCLLVTVFFAYQIIREPSEVVKSELQRSAKILADVSSTILQAVAQDHKMLDLDRIVNQVSSETNIVTRILRSDVTKKDFGVCDDGFNPDSQEKEVLATGINKTFVDSPSHLIRQINTIKAEKMCLRCHVSAKEGDILAVVSVNLDSKKTDRILADFSRFVKKTAVFVILIIFLLVIIFLHIVDSEEEKYRYLFTLSQDALMTLEPPKWNFTSGNPATVKMFLTKDEAEFLSFPPWELSPKLQPDNRPSLDKAKEMIETAMKNGSHFFEWTHKRANGELFPATVLLSRVKLRGKTFLQATVRDVTEQKKIETKVIESEQRLSMAVMTSGQGLWDWNIVKDETYLSPKYYELTGYQKGEINPNSAFFQSLIHPDDLSNVGKTMEEHIQGKSEYSIAMYRMKKKSGEYLWIDSVGKVVERDEKDAPLRMVGIIQDITNKINTEKALVEKERMSAIGELASGIAHDFNNALQVIFGNVELALLEENLSKDAEERLDSIRLAATNAGARIRQLQEFSREAKDKGIMAGININQLLDETIAQTKTKWKNEAEKRGLTINLKKEYHEINSIDGEIGQLGSVFINIIKNAIESMPSGGQLTFQTGNFEGKVRIRIIDTGIGMDEDVKKRVFQPFFTTKGFEQGKGLGMTGAYSIIRDHGGSIQVADTRPGNGTTIEILLPFGKEQVTAGAAEKSVSIAIPARVLLVDDEAPLRKVAKQHLTKRGHYVDAAGSGKEAIALLEENQYDLMVTDIGMPEMSGWQLIEKVQEGEMELPIVVTSGWGSNTEQMARYNIRHCLSKPVKMAELFQIIQDIMLTKTPTDV